MQKFLITLLLFSFYHFSISQNINPENITIARDEYGVPHIFTNTDAEAAYALAWVQSEDNFYDMQEPLLATKRLLSSEQGKDGALLDAANFLIEADRVVDEKYDETFSEDFKKIIQAYADGINQYAKTHPKEIRIKKLFPLTAKDIAKSYMTNMIIIANLQYDLSRIFENNLDPMRENFPSGSNGIAISPSRSTDNKTRWFLIHINHLKDLLPGMRYKSIPKKDGIFMGQLLLLVLLLLLEPIETLAGHTVLITMILMMFMN